MGPKSLEAALAGGRGAETGTALVEGFGAFWAMGMSGATLEAPSSAERPSVCDEISVEGWTPSIASKVAKEVKSVSFSGGAGADGEMVALRGIVMGGRPEDDDPEPPIILVGAVAPPANNGSLLPPGALDVASRLVPPRTPPPSLPPFSPDAPEAAVCAAFLFFLSIAMLCPGSTCARAHLWPNLQFPLMNHVQVSF